MKNLVKRAQAGNKEAFILLMEEHKQALYKIAVSMLKNDADAADAMQDTVLSSFENLQGLRQPEFFKTWLTRILINHCNRILKERGKMVPIYEMCIRDRAMTANTFKEDADAAADAGMNGFVTKPVDVEYLYQVLASLIKR